MKQVFTLAIVRKENKVLLARKMKKIGAGYWNGFGGKVEVGESIAAAAVRECTEEIGINPLKAILRGVLTFDYTRTDLGGIHEVHVFEIPEFTGVPTGTDEMSDPTWFAAADIPYEEMWEDDKYWLPLLLADKYFEGDCVFDSNKSLVKQNIREIEKAVAPLT
ncbi:MAG: 8-oxo-dGTP diphosphatase [Candidatus Andersenbacteria bacterium]